MSTIKDAASWAVETWRANPSFAAKELLNVELIPIQRVVLNRFWVARNGIALACRGYGKTYKAATLAILQALLFPGRRVGCLSASFRQAKQIFEEIKNIWQNSRLLQQCTISRPTISNDSCWLEFKPVPGMKPSKIVALPLSDGSKIRGQRFYVLLIDECVHVPEFVFNTVLRPMAATKQNPVQSMKIMEERERILSLGLDNDLEAEKLAELDALDISNQIYMFTSGYYSFNYVYNMYKNYSNRMHGLESDHRPSDFATFQIPSKAIPKGFLDPDALKLAEADMSPIEFAMEYNAAWISDSGGFFRVHHIEQCRAENLGLDCSIHVKGESDKFYIMTMDPARTMANKFAILISEWDLNRGIRIVHAEQYLDTPTPDMVDRIYQLCREFNIMRIDIDAGGGGREISDYLARGKDGAEPIYDMEDEAFWRLKGRHILRKINFSSDWINSANHRALNMLERRKIVFPRAPIEGGSDLEVKRRHESYTNCETMIKQILNIKTKQTPSGLLKFDLPDTGGGFVKHKDLYSAFLLACNLAYDLEESGLRKKSPMLHTGLIIPVGSW